MSSWRVLLQNEFKASQRYIMRPLIMRQGEGEGKREGKRKGEEKKGERQTSTKIKMRMMVTTKMAKELKSLF